MNQISSALNETAKCVFNNKHPTGNKSHAPPPHSVDGRKTPDRKAPIKTEPGFDQFPNGPKPEMESDNNDLFKRLKANRKMEIPECGCLGPGYVPSETIEGPYYTHLGTGSCLEDIKKMMEERSGLTGKAIRVERIIYSGKEGKSTQGCPIAKWIIRRAGVEEKLLCLVRHRRGHFCPTACLVICIVAWEGIPKSVADDMYSYLVPTLTGFGLETDRRCGYNEQKTCACQGVDMKKRGASFSFGCSWSMYFNGCKFARSREAKKFRLKDTALDEVVESKFQNLATRLAPLYKSIAPESYQNQVFFEDKGYECRLGHRTENDEKPCRPFSGVTACVDFCAHAHKDLHNMNNGCTVVVTLTKHGPLERPDEEQLHVLPLYILDAKNDSLEEKLKNGCVEILANYPKVARIRATPVTPKRKGRNAKKDSPSNKKENALASKLLNRKGSSSYMQAQVARNSTPVFSDKFPKATNISGFNNNMVTKANLFQNAGEKNMQQASSKGEVTPAISGGTLTNKPSETQKQPPLPANSNMYDKFWKYFYSYGTFPPANFLKDGNSAESMKFFASHLSDGKPVFAPPDTLLPYPASDPRKDMSGNVLARPGSACSVPLNTSNMKDIKCPYSVSSLTSDDFESPLHLLSEAVMIRSQTSVEKPRSAASHPQAGTNVSTPRKPVPNTDLSSSMGVASKSGVSLGAGSKLPSHLANQAFPNAKVPVELSKDQHSRFSSLNSNFDRRNIFDKDKLCQTSIASCPLKTSKQTSSQAPFTMETESQADCPGECMRDSQTEVISAELEYNEQSFSDPEIGGVAIALTHGSVLFEVAKRELHATTALLNPNRYSPTRISLVFYQHKSMNLRYHGWYENERKLELQRQKRLQKMQEEAEKNQPVADSELKPGSRKRRKKEEQPVVKCVPKYKSMWQAAIKHTITQSTDTIITQWIDPQPTVTGPYQKWI
ncbi:DNA N6-methyl adenine demethylase,Methylcytosine dioxygenase TET2,Methylcytosine dioxygenase tet3,Methylcytosine dioxygenase tet3-A,Methylcytosine dioxygenase TET3,Methylcytosine dioxygenase TET1,Methylcytosine dioxygenase tet3-B [Acanthosepion pharaonis]|uniref:Methylcytosine dioxygenase TET n=1 Tax=Acanthosepion pharaonis TaxID=158019 RepID=A0A812ECT5_ACAPH|nr:DNA N6-methyl adenine demethylase,Methylcytosine dioxygenase TET2,Methylcytosine dioxygenase tet3,Methylcytosine dioxygenase tet3-A,Methylcytosine dioxygenase TET3,Methylcytosine dioxygenase TET1,Methylcytosine dioxygenase tet3-B [Sepia pharaonis]